MRAPPQPFVTEIDRLNLQVPSGLQFPHIVTENLRTRHTVADQIRRIKVLHIHTRRLQVDRKPAT